MSSIASSPAPRHRLPFPHAEVPVRMSRLAAAALLAGAVVCVPGPATGQPGTAGAHGSQAESISGAWRARQYVLQDGPTHQVDGLIFFTDSDWTVLFFVVDGDGRPRRASAEGGTYTLAGDRLTFRHRYNASGGDGVEGLPPSDWSMSIRAAGEEPAEPCRIVLARDGLTIHFPSGNHMTFERSSR